MRVHGLFVVEGQLAVERLLSSRFCVKALLLTSSARDRLRTVLTSVEDVVNIYLATTRLIRTLTGFRFHRGCLGLGERMAPVSTAELLIRDKGRPVVALDGVSDPDNVGSIFRSAAAFGATGVILSPHCADPLYRKSIRTSMGMTLQLPYFATAEWLGILAQYRKSGVQVLAVTPDTSAIDLETFVQTGIASPRVLLFGSEGAGLSEGALAQCDDRVRIPIEESVDSINVVTAAAIVLQRFAACS